MKIKGLEFAFDMYFDTVPVSGFIATNGLMTTGTRYMNMQGMLPFENEIATFVERTSKHVLYRVTPIYKENNLVANGVQMEAYSIEDNGTGISFNVFVYNVQPGINIDYSTGKSSKK